MIHVIVGPPCAGKSTLCKERSSPGDVIVDFDALALALGSPEPHQSSGDVRSAAFEARAAVIAQVLKGITSDAWVIHTNPDAEKIAAYRAAGAVFEVVDPGIEVCLARAAERPAATVDVIKAWYGSPPDIQPTEAPEKSGAFFMPKFPPLKSRERPMFTKSCPLRVKAAGPDDGLEDGQFIAYASVFGNVDSYGDVVVQGAFAETLKEWEASEQNLPVLYGHDFYDPFSNIGWAVEYSEDDHGLLIKGQLDLDNPKAQQVYRLMKGRRIGDMSFAYDVLDSGPAEDPEGATELRKLHLYEVSVVPIGANQETEILAVKSAMSALVTGIKAGRVISVKDEGDLRKAHEVIGAVLTALDESKASSDPANAEEPPAKAPANAEEPSRESAELSLKSLELRRRFLDYES